MQNIFVLFGNDLPLLYKNLDDIEKSLLEYEPSLQFRSLAEGTMDDIINIHSSGNLFGENICIKIKKIKGNVVLEELKNSSCFFIFYSEEEKDPFSKFQDQNIVKKISCILPKPWEILKKIHQNFGKTISPQAADYLSNILYSLLEIDEIKKQMAFYNISYLDIHTLQFLYPVEDINTFSLVDYFFQLDKPDLFLSGVQSLTDRRLSIDGLLNTLLKQVKNLISVKKGILEKRSPLSIAQEIKLHAFIVEKMAQTVTKYTFRMLKDMIVHIVKVQFLSRYYSSQMDLILITRLFLEQKTPSYLR